MRRPAALAGAAALGAAALLATGAPAQDGARGSLDAEAFEALVEGRTLTYRFADGEVWGVERYYGDRRVTYFHAPDASCREGRWFPGGEAGAPEVCYAYEGDPNSPHCFPFVLDGGLLTYLDGATALTATEVGPEHGLPFGCGYVGS